MKHDFFDCMVDAHVIASSFEWDKHDRASGVRGLVGYMIAVACSIVSQPLESTVAVQIHIIRKLANPNHPFDLIDYESMLEEAQSSLLQMIPAAKKMLLLVLWPFDVIRRVLPFVGDESRLSIEIQRAMRSVPS